MISENTYVLKFEHNTYDIEKAGPALDRFWRPYLCKEWTVRLIAADFPKFSDLAPKKHWVEGQPDMVVRGSLRAACGDRYTYLPTGLLRAVIDFSRFFGKHGVPFEYDVSLSAPPLTGSDIIIGEDPFSQDARTWPPQRVYGVLAEDDDPAHGRSQGNPQDGLTKTSPRRYVCYAAIERRPIYKTHDLFKTFITAHHSIAVEAAVEFLTSEERIGELVSHFSPQNSIPEHVSLLLGVVCNVLNVEALNLAPGIPRIYLEIVRTELLKVSDGPLRAFASAGESADSQIEWWDKAERALDQLEAQGEYIEPYTAEDCTYPEEEDGYPILLRDGEELE